MSKGEGDLKPRRLAREEIKPTLDVCRGGGR